MDEASKLLRELQKQFKTRLIIELLATGAGSVQKFVNSEIVFVFFDEENFKEQALKILSDSAQ